MFEVVGDRSETQAPVAVAYQLRGPFVVESGPDVGVGGAVGVLLVRVVGRAVRVDVCAEQLVLIADGTLGEALGE